MEMVDGVNASFNMVSRRLRHNARPLMVSTDLSKFENPRDLFLFKWCVEISLCSIKTTSASTTTTHHEQMGIKVVSRFHFSQHRCQSR